MKISILGSSGFIGSSLAINILKEKKHDLLLASRSAPNFPTGRAEVLNCELFSKESFQQALADSDIAYYFLTTTSPGTSWSNPNMEAEITIKRFINFVEAAGLSKVKKIVIASSAGSIYGETSRTCTEEDQIKPFSPYGIGKQAEEGFCYYLAKKYKKSFDIFRISNPYGPRQEINNKGTGVISVWLKNILCEKPITIHDGSLSFKDYIYIDDLTEILNLPLLQDLDQCNIYNACSGKPVSLNGVLEAVKNITGNSFRSKVVQMDSLDSDNKRVVISNKKILKMLDRKDFQDIQTGIAKYWEYLQLQLNNS